MRTKRNRKPAARVTLNVIVTPILQAQVYQHLFRNGRQPMSAWVRSLIERALAKEA